MKFPAARDAGRDAGEAHAAIEAFLRVSKKPALLEPGEELLPLARDNYVVEFRNSRLTIQAWDEKRNLVRRVTGISASRRGKLELIIERFARKEGRLLLLDLARLDTPDWERRSARLVFRERFRQFLGRQFPDWKIAELTTEPNLEYSLSPVYPRALLRRGQSGRAAIGCAPDADASGCLSFGLIWLDYLRHRERRLTVDGLMLYLPAGTERTTCLRLRWLDPKTARYEIFTYTEEDYSARLDPSDFGNLDTKLETYRRPFAETQEWIQKLCRIPGVERVNNHDGTVSLRVRGLEFASTAGGELLFGLEHRAPVNDYNLAEVEQLASELASMRSAATANRDNPLYRRNPETWLESQVRAQIETLDASLWPAPVYGQVPAFAAGERGVIDLLAADRTGRLVILELKASPDIHLPLQALDYWMRVAWHLERNEFASRGYFAGITIRRDLPRLLLISPALEFHPTTEIFLSFFASSINIERIGLGLKWREQLEVVFRLKGSRRPI